MERKERLGNFVARSIAAVSIAAAGAAAVEKTGLFDPLTDSLESANHLVLNNLHNSYDQLRAEFPKAEKAEANPINIVTNLTNRPAGTNGTIAYFRFNGYTHLVAGSFDAAPGWNCTARSIPGDTINGDKFNCFTYCTPNNPVPAIGGALHIAFFNTGKAKQVIDQGWGALWPVPLGAEAGAQDGSVAGVGCSVGGVAEQPDVEALPQNIDSEESTDYTLPIAAGVAGAIATAIAATGGVLYSRKNRSSN